jgi:hypothetical protein
MIRLATRKVKKCKSDEKINARNEHCYFHEASIVAPDESLPFNLHMNDIALKLIVFRLPRAGRVA